MLFFDWLRFEEVFAENGCSLTWVRPKPVDGKHVDEIVGKRTPRVVNASGRGLRLSKMFISQIMAEGRRPVSVATDCATLLVSLE